MIIYKLMTNWNKMDGSADPNHIIMTDTELGESAVIPADANNRDYKEYLAWLEEGNVPEPADEVGPDYRSQRAAEYPSIGDQLDALFHAGMLPRELTIQIQAIKAKYPKV